MTVGGIVSMITKVFPMLQIVKPLGRIVGAGMFKCLPEEDAFLIKEFNVTIFIIRSLTTLHTYND